MLLGIPVECSLLKLSVYFSYFKYRNTVKFQLLFYGLGGQWYGILRIYNCLAVTKKKDLDYNAKFDDFSASKMKLLDIILIMMESGS